jgi:ketosteroid isomerase-like protein
MRRLNAALFAFVALASLCASALAGESVEALIQRQSQAFSDASASGDKAVLDRYLDDHVAFMNEDGSLATKKDIVDGAAPPPGVSNTLKQTDFTVHVSGPVAVTTFTDELTEDFHGQPFLAKFRSTEVWMNRKGRWRMISSQTLALPDDPAAVTLPASVLDQYVGTYEAAPGVVYTISRNGDAVAGSLNGAPAREMKAEAPDVLFTPGVPRLRKVFQRDAQGKVTAFLSRREGHDLVFRRTA